MEMSSQLHALSDLLPGKEPLVPTGYEAGWAPELVWTRWWSPYRHSTPDHPARSPALYRWAIPSPSLKEGICYYGTSEIHNFTFLRKLKPRVAVKFPSYADICDRPSRNAIQCARGLRQKGKSGHYHLPWRVIWQQFPGKFININGRTISAGTRKGWERQ
jgi:hypothetical protein